MRQNPGIDRRYRAAQGLLGQMEPATVGELLHWSYANLAMAHSALTDKSVSYGRKHFMIRARLYKGLNAGTMAIGPLAEDERLKMILPQACCYCASTDHLSIDHLIPTKKGGKNTGDNLVWACRSCNSSKCATDGLDWLAQRQQFPPLLLLRRYLKLAIELCRERGLLEAKLETAPQLPSSLLTVPRSYPKPTELSLWVTDVA